VADGVRQENSGPQGAAQTTRTAGEGRVVRRAHGGAEGEPSQAPRRRGVFGQKAGRGQEETLHGQVGTRSTSPRVATRGLLSVARPVGHATIRVMGPASPTGGSHPPLAGRTSA